MGLVQNHEGTVQGASAHIGQGRDFDGAVRHHLLDGARIQHLAQSIVEGAQVGVDFIGQGPGQEAQSFARFDRGARQDEARNLAFQQGPHRARHRQIGFPSPGRPDGESDGVILDVAHIGGLTWGFGSDNPLGIHQHRAGNLLVRHCGFSTPHANQRQHPGRGGLHLSFGTLQLQGIALHPHIYLGELVLQSTQIRVLHPQHIYHRYLSGQLYGYALLSHRFILLTISTSRPRPG